MTSKTKRRVGDSLGSALIFLSAAFGMLIGLRSIVAVELPGVRALLGLSPMPREALGLVWSPWASWPADFQQTSIDRMVAIVAALLLAATSVAVLNALIMLVDSGAARRRELAVRMAVGASPATATRLLLGPVRRVVTTAAAIGLVLGVLTGGALRASWPALRQDMAVVGALGELALPLCALIAIAAYAYAAVGVRLSFGRRLAEGLGDGGRVSDDRGAVALRRSLVALQMGAAGTVVVAGLLLASGLTSPEPEQLAEGTTSVIPVTMPEGLSEGGWSPVLEVLTEVPGVQAGSLATRGTLSGIGLRDYVTSDCGDCWRGGLPMPFWSVYADHYAVGPDFFDLAGFELSEGRAIEPGDRTGAQAVAVVNRTFARTAFEDGEPLGRQIRVGRGLEGWFTVVGVVENRHTIAPGGRDRPAEAVYLSLLQHPPRTAVALVSGTDDAAHEAWSRLSTLGMATGLPLTSTEHAGAVRAPQRWAALVSALLAALVLLSAASGTRVVSAQIVRRSTHALAIRRVLGSSDRRILRHVLAGAARSGLWGAAISVFFGTLTVALLREALGGLSTPGPLPYLFVAALLTCTALGASWGAARAATRVPPGSALQ